MLLHYFDTGGAGTPIVLLHGMAASTRYWDTLIPYIQNGHRIVALDLLGFGHSPKPKDITYNYTTHIESIVQTLDYIDIKRPFVLLGHSMGALIALRLAATYPKDISKIVLVAMPIYSSAVDAHRDITSSSILKQWAYYGISSKILCTVWCRWLRPLSCRLAPKYLPHLTKESAKDSVLHTWQSYAQSLHFIIENQQVTTDAKQYNKPITLVYGDSDIPQALRTNKLKNFSVTILNGTHQIINEHPNQIAQLL